MDIASKLERNRVIANKYSFYVKTKLQDADIMAGTYEINSSMTYGEILDIISDYSKSIVQDPNVETNKDEAGKDAKADKGEAEKDTKASKDESSKDAKTDKSESKKNTKTKKDKSNK